MEPICHRLRPDWDGAPSSALSETLALSLSPVPILLFLCTLLAFRFRHQWGALLVVVAWSLYVSFLTVFDTAGTLAAGRVEGCVGSPSLFIGLVAAICIAMILYTAPLEKRETNGDQ